MQHKQFFYVANWKMSMSANAATLFIDQTVAWVKRNPILAHQIIICPSYTLLMPLRIGLGESPVYLGAQNCSEYASGAYTSQVSARDLAEIDADFCLIGHSECRTLLNESNDSIGAKALRLFEQGLNPIFCIGETAQEYNQGQTDGALIQQLEPLIRAVAHASSWPSALLVAYEPVWAIGSGKTPDNQALQKLFVWLKEYLRTHIPSIAKIYLLYGGSVDSSRIAQLKAIEPIDGFLIGGASLDFQKFKNIVGLD